MSGGPSCCMGLTFLMSPDNPQSKVRKFSRASVIFALIKLGATEFG